MDKQRLACAAARIAGEDCVLCGAPGSALCGHCLGDLPALEPACAFCSAPRASVVNRCPDCRAWQTPVQAAWHYSFPLDAIIARLKYRGDLGLVRVLPALLQDLCVAVAAADCVIPVPLHRARLAERGYNQAHLIAAALTRQAGIAPPVSALRRERNTATQATLLGAARQRNVAGAFSVQEDVQGRTCVLVDDVVTTGSTLQAAAAALRTAGARQVLGVALARAGHATGVR